MRGRLRFALPVLFCVLTYVLFRIGAQQQVDYEAALKSQPGPGFSLPSWHYTPSAAALNCAINFPAVAIAARLSPAEGNWSLVILLVWTIALWALIGFLLDRGFYSRTSSLATRVSFLGLVGVIVMAVDLLGPAWRPWPCSIGEVVWSILIGASSAQYLYRWLGHV